MYVMLRHLAMHMMQHDMQTMLQSQKSRWKQPTIHSVHQIKLSIPSLRSR